MAITLYRPNLLHDKIQRTGFRFRLWKFPPHASDAYLAQYYATWLAQITLERLNDSSQAHWKRLNTVIRYTRSNVAYLKFLKIDVNGMRTVGYSDAAFANNNYLKSQLGWIILLMDDDNYAIQVGGNRLHWFVRRRFSAQVSSLARN